MSIYLLPGEVCVSKEPKLVTTILGSCISVTMFDIRLKTAAICHARLPRGWRTGALDYVDNAVKYMVETLEALGTNKDELEVNLFGGADVLSLVRMEGKSIGRQNVETAIEVIKEIGLCLSGRSVGGTAGRKVSFQTSTGKVSWTVIGAVQ